MRARYVLIDLFAGCGGFSRGFADAGFKVAVAIESFKPVAETFKRNFTDAHVIVEDIKKVPSGAVREVIGDSPDIIIGGPPCEPFTAARQFRKRPLARLYGTGLGRLVLEFVRFVAELRPKVFVMENVVGIMEGELRRELEKLFRRAGYRKIYFNVLHAEDYGTPSRRRRVFISNIEISPPKAGKVVTAWEAIRDLPDPESNHEIPNHDPVPLSPRKLRAIARLRPGQALVRYVGADGRVKMNFIRIRPNEPAPPVMGKSRFIHPFSNRLLTVREHARLMGFPDTHVFLGGRNVQFDMVGEAVPPPLARAIASVVAEELRYL